MKNDDMSDDEFDAFLNGKDDLSRRLQALPQPSSSAELDATIFKRIQLSMEQEMRPEAANDAGEPPQPRLQSGFGVRWRVPAGIAATLLAGVFAHQVFDASQAERADMVTAPVQMAPAAPEMVAPPPPPPAAAPEPRAVEPLRRAEKVAPAKKPEQKRAAAQVEAAPAPVVEEKAVEPPSLAAAPAAPAPPAPLADQRAPVRAAARASSDAAFSSLSEKSSGRVTVTGLSARVKSADEWLAVIDAMLKAELKNDAREEWTRFRKAYPDYPVPDELKARIETP